MTKTCTKHAKTPVKGYSDCPGCEVEGLRDRIAELERQVAELRKQLTEQSEDSRDAALKQFVAGLPRYNMKTYQNNGYDWNAERVQSSDGEFVMFEDVSDGVAALAQAKKEGS